MLFPPFMSRLKLIFVLLSPERSNLFSHPMTVMCEWVRYPPSPLALSSPPLSQCVIATPLFPFLSSLLVFLSQDLYVLTPGAGGAPKVPSLLASSPFFSSYSFFFSTHLFPRPLPLNHLPSLKLLLPPRKNPLLLPPPPPHPKPLLPQRRRRRRHPLPHQKQRRSLPLLQRSQQRRNWEIGLRRL